MCLVPLWMHEPFLSRFSNDFLCEIELPVDNLHFLKDTTSLVPFPCNKNDPMHWFLARGPGSVVSLNPCYHIPR